MSHWTYIEGTISVSPMGRTQEEMTYVLQTVLKHLPKVTGSEADMYVHCFPKCGKNHSCNVDEFGQFSNTLPYTYFGREMENQDKYIVVVEGHFRDREFEETKREFLKWLCRLAKRVYVDYVLAEVYDNTHSLVIRDRWNTFDKMFEAPSNCNSTGEPNWCEYMLWQPMKDKEYPAILGYKYFKEKENDERVETWLRLKER